MIEGDLVNYILQSPGMYGLIGTRIYPQVLPQDKQLPAITYQRIVTNRQQMHDGPAGMAEPLFQIDIWDTSYLTVKNIAESLRSLLEGFSGLVGNTKIIAIFLVDDRDDYESERKLQRVSMDFKIFYQE